MKFNYNKEYIKDGYCHLFLRLKKLYYFNTCDKFANIVVSMH